jgi:hypothetical protein
LPSRRDGPRISWSRSSCHLTGYVGVPIIREALLVASKVFAEVKAERAGKS